MIRTLLLLAVMQAAVGLQVATRLARTTVARTPAPAMLDVPTALLAKSEADMLLGDVAAAVFPLGTAAGVAVRLALVRVRLPPK